MLLITYPYFFFSYKNFLDKIFSTNPKKIFLSKWPQSFLETVNVIPPENFLLIIHVKH